MFLQFGCCRLKGASCRVVVIFRTGRQTQNSASKVMSSFFSSWILHLRFLFFFSPPLSHHCSPLSSLPSVWTLLWPKGAVPLWLSLPTPLRQQDLYVLLPPQQHRLQVLLQRDWVPVGHAGQPHHHLWWLCTQVSNHFKMPFESNGFTLCIFCDKILHCHIFPFFFLGLEKWLNKRSQLASSGLDAQCYSRVTSSNIAHLNKVSVKYWESWHTDEKWAAQDTYGQGLNTWILHIFPSESVSDPLF